VGIGAYVQISGLTLAHAAGAIDNAGSVVINNCTISDNSGAIHNTGSATINNSILTNNSAGSYAGAIVNLDAVYNTGTLIVSGSTLTGNIDGAIFNDGSATVSNSTLEDNSDGTIDGAILNDSSLTVNNSILSSNGGDALANYGSATVNYSTLSGNRGYQDGAIFNSGNLTVNNSTLSANQALGIAAYTYMSGSPEQVHFSPAGNGAGGGIYMNGGALSINSSTLADNEARGGPTAGPAGTAYGGPAENGFGGSLYIASGTVSINNSTLADNHAVSGTSNPATGGSPGVGYGGGIYNTAGPGALQMHDTILADDTADVAPDLDGGLASQGYNLIGNSTGGSGFAASDLLNVNPQLGPLQNNGGPTQTMALVPGSLAVNGGDNTNAPVYDQRGPGSTPQRWSDGLTVSEMTSCIWSPNRMMAGWEPRCRTMCLAPRRCSSSRPEISSRSSSVRAGLETKPPGISPPTASEIGQGPAEARRHVPAAGTEAEIDKPRANQNQLFIARKPITPVGV
jgi:hypothetical protein